jgi:ferredoxin
MGMQRDFSSYVITDPCRGVKDATCTEVCPVDCIESSDDQPQFFINPELCIVCEQCVLVCPVDAIFLEHEVPEQWRGAIERNAAFFKEAVEAQPLISEEEARALIGRAAARASELGVDVAIAVVDREGNDVAADLAGLPPLDAALAAQNKAYSAALMERSTSDLNQRMASGARDVVDRSRLVLEAGGIPFGRPYVVAGLGVSGATPEQNHECARAALAP